MYRILRYLSDNFILILTLTIITLFVSLGSSYIRDYSQNIYEGDYYIGTSCIGFNISNFQEISYKQFLDFLFNEGNCNVFNINMSGESSMAQGIYLKEDLKITPELIKGRFFNREDFINSHSRLAVIGKGLINNTKVIEGTRYITFNKEDYKVIGIMGNEKKQKMLDYTMIFNLNSLADNDNYMKVMDGWYISSYKKNLSMSDIIQRVNKKLQDLNKDVSLTEMELKIQPNPTLTAIRSNKNMMVYFIILIGSIALNILIILYQWIGELEKPIGIRKAFGAKNYHIYWFVFKNYIIDSLTASFLSLLIHILLVKINLFQSNEGITLTNFVVVTIFSFIFSDILLCISIRRLNKLQPNYIMKGC